MIEVTNVSMTGGAYHRGMYCPGWGTLTVKTDDGLRDVYVPSKKSNCFDDCLAFAVECGYNVDRMKERLAVWVKTGTCPPHKD